MRQSLSRHPQTTRHCSRDGAFHLRLGGLAAVFLTVKPADFHGKAWVKVLEHKPPVPGFGGDLGSSSRKAQRQGLVVLCPGGAWMARGALCAITPAQRSLGGISALRVHGEKPPSAARKNYFGLPSVFGSA